MKIKDLDGLLDAYGKPGFKLSDDPFSPASFESLMSDFLGMSGGKPGGGSKRLASQNSDGQRRTPWLGGPRPKQAKILKAALDAVNSVPYRVSSRWVFYRLYQAGLYTRKEDYSSWGELSSRARHTGWDGWRPDTLADDTREAVVRTGGYINETDARRDLGSRLRDASGVSIDHFHRQQNYIELWFEARAMVGQFQHYTKDIDLVPMAGQPSIPFKWNLAKRLEAAAGRYGLPIVILYFGDEDLSGHVIEETIRLDVGRWCEAPFTLERCGLSVEQAEKHGVPPSVEKKGYQWEALDDTAAEEIITDAVGKYIDVDLIDEADAEAEEVAEKCGEIIEEILGKMGDDHE